MTNRRNPFRGTEQDMDVLHGLTVAAWKSRLERATRQESPEPLTAAEMTALIKFLKDNNIVTIPGSRSEDELNEVAAEAGLNAIDDDEDDNVVQLPFSRS